MSFSPHSNVVFSSVLPYGALDGCPQLPHLNKHTRLYTSFVDLPTAGPHPSPWENNASPSPFKTAQEEGWQSNMKRLHWKRDPRGRGEGGGSKPSANIQRMW